MLTNFSKSLQFEVAQKSCVWFLTCYIATDRQNKAILQLLILADASNDTMEGADFLLLTYLYVLL
jgi:hypothetical protein